MFITVRTRTLAAMAAVCALTVGVSAGPASAATQQRGLVNVSASDVNVPIGVAANVCNVSANVIAEAIGSQQGVGECDAVAEPTATGGGNNNTRQQGLVNVALTDVNVPVGVAANVCDVSIGVLSSALGTQQGVGRCEAVALPTAQ